MTNYKKPELRATETVTFRFTLGEKLLLGKLAKAEKKTKTDLIRELIARRAEQTGVYTSEPESPIIRPERFRKYVFKENGVDVTASETVQEGGISDSCESGMTFGELVNRFREHFSDRADGTRKELDDTVRFFCKEDHDGEKLLSLNTPLQELTSQKLMDIRNKMIGTDLRMAKMNLHLTYLRMMLHFAAKQSSIYLSINPGDYLKPFTVSEIPQSWPGRRS
jgi:hypothetical protein